MRDNTGYVIVDEFVIDINIKTQAKNDEIALRKTTKNVYGLGNDIILNTMSEKHKIRTKNEIKKQLKL